MKVFDVKISSDCQHVYIAQSKGKILKYHLKSRVMVAETEKNVSASGIVIHGENLWAFSLAEKYLLKFSPDLRVMDKIDIQGQLCSRS